MAKFWEKLFGKPPQPAQPRQPVQHIQPHQPVQATQHMLPTQEDKLDLIQRQLVETTRILREDIHKLAARGEKLSELEGESKKLEEESKVFFRESEGLRRKNQVKNTAFITVFFAIIIGALHGAWAGYALSTIILESLVLGLAVLAINWVVLKVKQKINVTNALSLEIKEESESSNISLEELKSLSRSPSVLTAFNSSPTSSSSRKRSNQLENKYSEGSRSQMKI